METLVERYTLLDSLLFKIITTPEKGTALLAIPENCADKIITLYHMKVCLQDTKVFLKLTLQSTISFFIPNLIHYLRSVHKMDVIFASWQAMKNLLARQLHMRINPNYIPLSRLSIRFESQA